MKITNKTRKFIRANGYVAWLLMPRSTKVYWAKRLSEHTYSKWMTDDDTLNSRDLYDAFYNKHFVSSCC